MPPMVSPNMRKSNQWDAEYVPLINVPIVPPTTTTTTAIRSAHSVISTNVILWSPPNMPDFIGFMPTARLHFSSSIAESRALLTLQDRRPAAPSRSGRSRSRNFRNRRSDELLLRVDLHRILADLERRRITVGELIDREVEGAALAVLVAVDGPADAVVALGRKQRVPQGLAANIGRAVS